MAIPKPGMPVRGSRSGRPIMALLDLLGRRWVMRVIWELRGEPLTFRALRERCDDMSPTVLNQRLHELREAGIIGQAEGGGYALSELGAGLLESMGPLLQWSERWQRALDKEQP
ncbi:winged helix-turn-helix transcriptional regulator [Pseudoduganella namucuonensis]|uniref:Transcriptional regulator, HxlR family n=1 Tax=Pseudoduganella namucuonensis TaxID=1035707 RepID=A0A1I7K5N7_9BURK|nr:helix-turn-helix domain-containing protein [Pseudoduganella namucuonensis]SFU92753.1 transcriptional regulator, HxlR family [Pseudoduganella namucuonensis]